MTDISKMNFKIVAAIAGSETDGGTVGIANLKQTDFSIKFVDESKVNACAGNFLKWDQGTWYDGQAREQWVNHTIAADSIDTPASCIIPAKKISSAIAGCEIDVKVEVYSPFAHSADGSQGAWVEWRPLSTSDDITFNLDQA
jgi:hypothetical protein